jgi:hypothetical protein
MIGSMFFVVCCQEQMLVKRLVTPAQHVGGVQQQLTSMSNHVLLK